MSGPRRSRRSDADDERVPGAVAGSCSARELPMSIHRVVPVIAVLLLLVGSRGPDVAAQHARPAAADTPRFRLRALPAAGAYKSSAAAINEQGEIAGTITTPGASPVPAFWSAPDVEPQLATGPGADWTEVLDVGAS